MNHYQEELKALLDKYSKRTLTISELAIELGQSIHTIRRGIKNGKGIPPFRKVGGGETRQTVVFPITDVARFLTQTEKVF